jgi:hypothetical protein
MEDRLLMLLVNFEPCWSEQCQITQPAWVERILSGGWQSDGEECRKCD